MVTRVPDQEPAAHGEAAMISGYHARQLARYLLGAISDTEQRGGAVPKWIRQIADATATAGITWERRVASESGTDVRNPSEDPSAWAAVNIMTASEVAVRLGVTSRWVSELAAENVGELRPLRRDPLLFWRADVLALEETRSR